MVSAKQRTVTELRSLKYAATDEDASRLYPEPGTWDMGLQAQSGRVSKCAPHDMMVTDRSACVATVATEFHCAVGSYFVTVD
jgi:hypothetical protein